MGGLGFRVTGGYDEKDPNIRVWGLGFKIGGLGFEEFRVWGLGFKVGDQGFEGFGVWGLRLGFRI